jgi:hypothetical protein
MREIRKDFAKILDDLTLNVKIIKDTIIHVRILSEEILAIKTLNEKVLSDEILNYRALNNMPNLAMHQSQANHQQRRQKMS